MHKIIPFQSIDSTNSYLKENFKSLAEGDVCFSLHQTGGKGRRGRVWQDEGKDLLFSILFLEGLNEKLALALPLLSGAAVAQTLVGLGFDPKIKWPNDVLLNDKKCCGILVEGVSETSIDAIISGIGINLNEDSFPEDIAYKATSLHIQSGLTYDPKEVLSLFLKEFDELYEDYKRGGKRYLTLIRERFYLLGKEVYLNYHNENLSGTVEGIDDEGSLLLNDGKKVHHLISGEVSLEKTYKR
ncbi:MAG: biotin--[acetyl-CoA-carboxylase] ligase [Candidatus Enteromonas sp.]|jgi:BirA family biotin operon repressor/biotin-[acetyl-CoA-carboxylase] ligase|nr:biotin--[acetyl-CoA-carboxylase] ligase [Candidatus Enteromonas sp.]